MSYEKEVLEHHRKLGESMIQTFPAVVISIDKDNATVTVKDDENIEYDDVRLTSIVGKSDSSVIYPKAKSSVLVSIINNDETELYVSAYSDVEEIASTMSNTEYSMTQKGFKFERDGENLKVVLNDFIAEFGKLCDEISKVVVAVGVTPNVGVIQQIKTKATTVLKERLNTILTD